MDNTIKNVISLTKDLILEDPFYGIFLTRINKKINTEVPYIGIGYKDKDLNLYINPNTWFSLSENCRKGAIIHELLHLVFFHLTDTFNEILYPNRKLLNTAMDLCINQYISSKYLDEDWVGISIEKEPFNLLNLLPNKSTDYYYHKLKNDCNFLSIEIGTINDDHSLWSDKLEEIDKEILKVTLTENIISSYRQKGNNKSYSSNSIDSIIEKLIEEKNKKSEINYGKYLKQYCFNNIETKNKRSRKKLNKRYIQFPGKKRDRVSKVLVGIDTSGSISDDELEDFLNHINHIKNSGANIDVTTFDTSIKNIIPYSKNSFKRLEISRGGTDFNPIVDTYIQEKKYNCLIVLTDGEASNPINKTTRPIIWVLNTSKEKCKLPGIILEMN